MLVCGQLDSDLALQASCKVAQVSFDTNAAENSAVAARRAHEHHFLDPLRISELFNQLPTLSKFTGFP